MANLSYKQGFRDDFKYCHHRYSCYPSLGKFSGRYHTLISYRYGLNIIVVSQTAQGQLIGCGWKWKMANTSNLTEQTKCAKIDDNTRGLLMTIRQALIMMLGALEDFLGLPRSIIPKHKRNWIATGRKPSGAFSVERETTLRRVRRFVFIME